jgi:hypothetical protein
MAIRKSLKKDSKKHLKKYEKKHNRKTSRINRQKGGGDLKVLTESERITLTENIMTVIKEYTLKYVSNKLEIFKQLVTTLASQGILIVDINCCKAIATCLIRAFDIKITTLTSFKPLSSQNPDKALIRYFNNIDESLISNLAKLNEFIHNKLPELSEFLRNNVFISVNLNLIYQPIKGVDTIREIGSRMAKEQQMGKDKERALSAELDRLMMEETKRETLSEQLESIKKQVKILVSTINGIDSENADYKRIPELIAAAKLLKEKGQEIEAKLGITRALTSSKA